MTYIRNLLQETHEAISESGHRRGDVVFVGSKDGEYGMTWAEFEQLADAEYDSGYGGAQVASDLIVRFSDGRKLWRGEYDGSEWWEFDTPEDATWQGAPKPIQYLFTVTDTSLKDLHGEDGEWRRMDRS